MGWLSRIELKNAVIAKASDRSDKGTSYNCPKYLREYRIVYYRKQTKKQ